MNFSSKYKTISDEIASFAGSSIRLLLDQSVPLTLCSFAGSMRSKTRSQVLYEVANTCNLSISDLLTLLGNGFRFYI